MLKALTIFAAILAAGVAIPAAAQRTALPSPMLDELAKCRSERDDGRRLTCYDAAAAALIGASGKGDVIVVSREDVRRTRRSLFGFNLPKLPFFGGDDSQEGAEADEVEVKIRSYRAIESGKYAFEFDDGSSWRTTEVKNIRPRNGAPVTIKKAALGSYFLRVGGRAVRGMRVR